MMRGDKDADERNSFASAQETHLHLRFFMSIVHFYAAVQSFDLREACGLSTGNRRPNTSRRFINSDGASQEPTHRHDRYNDED